MATRILSREMMREGILTCAFAGAGVGAMSGGVIGARQGLVRTRAALGDRDVCYLAEAGGSFAGLGVGVIFGGISGAGAGGMFPVVAPVAAVVLVAEAIWERARRKS